jgi:hypothetical protein
MRNIDVEDEMQRKRWLNHDSLLSGNMPPMESPLTMTVCSELPKLADLSTANRRRFQPGAAKRKTCTFSENDGGRKLSTSKRLSLRVLGHKPVAQPTSAKVRSSVRIAFAHQPLRTLGAFTIKDADSWTLADLSGATVENSFIALQTPQSGGQSLQIDQVLCESNFARIALFCCSCCPGFLQSASRLTLK